MTGIRVQSGAGPASVRQSRVDLETFDDRHPQASTPKSSDSFQSAPKKTLSTLKRGATGAEVRGLQAKLQLLGLMKAGDIKSGPGVYGPRTEHAVARFQERLGLPVTGVADPGTRAAIMGADRTNQETTAPTISPLELSRMAQTMTDEDDDATNVFERAAS